MAVKVSGAPTAAGVLPLVSVKLVVVTANAVPPTVKVPVPVKLALVFVAPEPTAP